MTDESAFEPRSTEPRSTDSVLSAAAAAAATKPKKRIVTNVTVHVPGPEHEPYVYEGGFIKSGAYHAIEYPPGTVVELDADEADRLIARHGGEEIGPDYEVPAGVGGPVENRRQ